MLNSEDMGDLIRRLTDIRLISDQKINKGMIIDMSADHDTKTGKTTATAGVSGESSNGRTRGSVSGSVSTQPGSKSEGSVHGEIHIKI
jgi:hypothetical protein